MRPSSTAIKRLAAFYFRELKDQLGEQNGAFWAKIRPKHADKAAQQEFPTQQPRDAVDNTFPRAHMLPSHAGGFGVGTLLDNGTKPPRLERGEFTPRRRSGRRRSLVLERRQRQVDDG
jgi:hypothetical protein